MATIDSTPNMKSNQSFFDFDIDIHIKYYKPLINTWQYYSKYNEETNNVNDLNSLPIVILYNFMTGKIPKEPANVDKYKRLFDAGYIVSKSNQTSAENEYVNLVVSTMSENDLEAYLPAIPNDLKKLGEKLDETMYKLNKPLFPKHLQEVCRLMNQNTMTKGDFRFFVLKSLLKRGVLKPLKKQQLPTVNMIMFCDTLPEQAVL